MTKSWQADKFDWTPEGMKECIYGHGDWIRREDYIRRMSELLETIVELTEENNNNEKS